jgi:hypothetical protein
MSLPEERDRVIAKALEDDRRAMKLADGLGQCADSCPCSLSICPLCVRKIRRSFIMKAITFINGLGLGPLARITEFGDAVSVSSRQYFLQGMLDHIDLGQINRHIHAQHERADFPLAFAGIEIVLNDNRGACTNDDPPFWQARVRGIVVGLEADAVESAIKREYPREASSPTPLSLSKCRNLAAALDSAIKPEFVRNASPRNPGLKNAQLNETALWLNLYEPKVRYVLTGCHFDGTRFELHCGVQRRLQELTLGETAPRFQA